MAGAQQRVLPARLDGATVVARLVALLVRPHEPPHPDLLHDALAVLLDGLQLRSAVLHDVSDGSVLATAGEVVRAVPLRRGAPPASVELPVRGLGGGDLAVLAVAGALPATLPALRTAAAVLGLALARQPHAGPSLDPLGRALLADVEADRAQLASLLHDGAVQDLVAARYAIDAATRGQRLEDARDAVQAALVALRRSLWHLRPRGEGDLAAALSALSDRLLEAGLRPLVVRADAGVEVLPATAATTAYRLVQALALEPSASAGALLVVLQRTELAVVVDVGGAPRLTDPQRWHRRARALGGDLSLAGCRWRLSLPLDPAGVPPAPRTSPPTPKAVP